MKKVIHALAALLMIPLSIMPAAALLKAKAKIQQAKVQHPHNLLAALELASTLKSPLQLAFGDEPIEPEKGTIYQLFDKTIQELLDKININCNPTSNVTTDAKKQDALKIILQNIALTNTAIKNKNSVDFENSMQQIYAIFTSELIAPESTTVLGKIPWGTKKAYLKINSDMATISEPIRADIVAILSFFWLKYISIKNNDPVKLTLNKKDFTLSALKWAYYTSHAGLNEFNETKNDQFNFYSRIEIRKIFETALLQSDDIIQYIDQIMASENYSATDKKTAITTKASDIANIYQLLFQPKQTDSFFNLKPEFQDAYQILPNNELDQLPAVTLCKIASIWLSIIEAKNNQIFDANDFITLTYPTLWNYDKNPPEKISNMPFDKWAYCTAHAGYNRSTENKRYKTLLEKPVNAPIKNNYDAWTKNIKDKVASLFSGLIVTKQHPFDF